MFSSKSSRATSKSYFKRSDYVDPTLEKTMDLKLLGLTDEILGLLMSNKIIGNGRCDSAVTENCATETNINVTNPVITKDMTILPNNINMNAQEMNIKIGDTIKEEEEEQEEKQED